MSLAVIHTATFNLALIMRSRCGHGTPRGLTAAAEALADGAARGLDAIHSQIMRLLGLPSPQTVPCDPYSAPSATKPWQHPQATSSAAC